MRTYKASRRELFERLDQARARDRCRASPSSTPSGSRSRLNIDYHVEFDGHFYSAPHGLRCTRSCGARATATTVEIFTLGRARRCRTRAATRAAATRPITEHMPIAHQRHAEWTPDADPRLGAGSRAEHARSSPRRSSPNARHPEHGYRSCFGIFRLAKRYGNERLDAACARALSVGARSLPTRRRRSSSTASTGARALDVEPREPRASPTRTCVGATTTTDRNQGNTMDTLQAMWASATTAAWFCRHRWIGVVVMGFVTLLDIEWAARASCLCARVLPRFEQPRSRRTVPRSADEAQRHDRDDAFGRSPARRTLLELMQRRARAPPSPSGRRRPRRQPPTIRSREKETTC